MYHFTVPEWRKIRVIVDSDAKNEADDQYAITHAILSPKLEVKGVIAAHFGKPERDTMMESYEECVKLCKLLHTTVKPYKGSHYAINSETDYEISEGAQLIIDEAMKDDDKPLFVIFLGPITDLACAYLAEPRIAGRLTAIWIGGGKYPEGCQEFNLKNDVKAANVIFRSPIALWQVPMGVYSSMLLGIAEIQDKVEGCGKLGKYLFQQLADFNATSNEYPGWPSGEVWCFGDSAAVGLLLDSQTSSSTMMPAPVIDENYRYTYPDENLRPIRVYQSINSRFILEDFFAKLRIFAREIEPKYKSI